MRLAVTVPLSHWFTRGNLSEVRRWLDRALALSGTASAVRAAALLFDSHLAISQRDGEVGLRLLDEGDDLARELGAVAEIASAAYVRGVVLLYRGDLPAAIEAFGRVAVVLATAPEPEPWTELQVLHRIALGAAAALAGDHARAGASLREVLAITESRGESRYRSFALWAQAMSAWRLGNVHDTMTSLATSLRLKHVPGSTDRFGTARCFEAMDWVAARQEQYERAVTLLGAAEAVWTEIGTPITIQGHMSADHEACERQVREELGETAFTDAFRPGQALSRDEALACALHERRQRVPPPPKDGSTPLTRREDQVAGLVAEGLSNHEIATKLVISRRTAESHVEHILTKLGFTSRAQVAAWRPPGRVVSRSA